jgi:hypothetical protein
MGLAALVGRVRGEYREMPGLRLTVRQAARLFGMSPDDAEAVLGELRRTGVLMLSADGAYAPNTEPSRWRRAAEARRPWTWTDIDPRDC